MSDAFAERASIAIDKRADRLLASAAGRQDEPERIRRAAALKTIARQVALGEAAIRLWKESAAPERESIDAGDFERAGNEVNALADLEETGWGTDRFYGLALALHYDSYRDYLRAGNLETIGAYKEALETFENLKGDYARYAAESAARCRKRLKGSYDEAGERRKAMSNVVALVRKHGLDPSPVQDVTEAYAAEANRKVVALRSSTPSESVTVGSMSERASTFAQLFAERLVDGDYEGAHRMLAAEMGGIGVDEIRERYESMICAEGEDEPGEVTVQVIDCNTTFRSRRLSDLGWVYVAISGNCFNEAVVVTVTTEDGEPRIRELEWGRP